MTDRSRLTTLAAIALGAWAAGAALPAAAQPGPGGHNRPGQPARGRPAPQRRPVNRRPPPPPPGGPMAVGRRMPSEYRGYNYRVEEWQRYNLPRPRGSNFWVQYGGDFVELSPAGIVIQIFGH